MNNLDTPAIASTDKKARNAVLISVFMTVFMVALASYFLLQGKSLSLLLTVSLIVMTSVSVMASWFSYKGYVQPSMLMLIGTFLVMLVIDEFIGSDNGLANGLLGAVVTVGIATATLSGKWFNWTLIAGGLGGLLIVFINLFSPTERLVQTNTTIDYVFITVLTIVFLLFIIRGFRNYPLRGKLILSLIGVTVVTLVTIGVFFLTNIRNTLQEQVITNQFSDVAVKVTGINTFLASANSDTLFLSQSPALHNYLDAINTAADPAAIADARALLEAEFLTFAQNHVIYDQIRFLDTTGQEIVRVNTSAEGISSVAAESDLQNKGQRYYFKNGIGLRPGEVYISPLDLNVEGGEIEIPYKPVIRYATPVVVDGQTYGIVVGNILAERFLAPLGDSDMDTFLVDTDGYYLYHPDQSKRWGRDLRTGITVFQETPQLAPILTSGKVDSFSTAEQLFTFSPVTLPGETSPRWYLAAFDSLAAAQAPVNSAVRTGLVVLIMTVTVAVVVAVFVSQLISVPVIELTHTVERLAAGDLEAEAEVRSTDEIGKLAAAFNEMAARLQQTLGGLQARSRDLELTVDMGRDISQVRDLTDMLSNAVELIRDRFDLYYAQVYLTDAAGRVLLLQAGTGEVGKILVERGHRLPVATGSINGTAAAKQEAIIVTDTEQSTAHQANPLLPHTRSEMAVPLIADGRLLGILDLQSDQPGRLRADYLPVFETLAAQLAFAIQNATLFTETERARAAVEAQVRQSMADGWKTFFNAVERSERLGVAYDIHADAPLAELPLPAPESHHLAVPIAIAGATVGSIRLEDYEGRTWAKDEMEVVQAVADKVARQAENLRLVNEAKRARFEAEQASRRLTREGWESYLAATELTADGFVYDRKQVRPLMDEGSSKETAVSQPLAVRGEAIGQLTLTGLDEIDEEAAALIQVVSEKVSERVEALRLTAQTEHALAGTEALYRGSDRLVRAKTFQDVLQSLVTSTMLKDCESTHILLFNRPWEDEMPESLLVAAEHINVDGESSLVSVGTWLEMDQLPTVKLFSPEKPLLLENLAHNEQIEDDFKDMMASVNIRGIAVFPLMAGGHSIGMVTGLSSKPLNWTVEQTRQTNSLVEQAATAIQTIRLLQETQQRAEHEALVNSITQKIQRTMTVKSALETAVQELGQALGVHHIQISLTSEENGEGEPDRFSPEKMSAK